MHSIRLFRAPFAPLTLSLLWLILALVGTTPARGQTTLVSHTATSPTTAAGSGFGFTVSEDGRFVVFESGASNLVTGQTDTNGAFDVFLHDRTTGTNTLVSHSASSNTTTGDGESAAPSISADGRFVAFISNSEDLIAGQIDGGSGTNVYLYDRTTGTNTLVSHAAASALTTANERSFFAIISADGNFVVFHSDATNLIAGQVDGNASNNGGATDIFLYNRTTGTNTLVSHTATSNTTTGNTGSSSSRRSISADGRFVVFTSPATNLVAGVTEGNGGFDTFLHNRTTGTNTLVSHAATSNTTTGNAISGSGGESISADGNFVAYTSFATNLVVGQTDSSLSNDVFLYNRTTGTNTLVSHSAASATTTGSGEPSVHLHISADGNFVAHTNTAPNLVVGQTDTNGLGDAFLYDRTTGTNTLVSHIAASPQTPASLATTGNGSSSAADLSADGRFVAVTSKATNLIIGQTDTNALFDAFLYDRTTGESTLVSRSAASATTTGNDNSNASTLSADGSVVAFVSEATNLVPGQTDTANTQDGFLFLADDGACSTVVINTNDAGAGSLREAINCSNTTAGKQTISFSIGTGARTITPATPLPAITDPVIIDGNTQPGFAGTPLIVITAGAGARPPSAFGGGLRIQTDDSIIKGLVINNFASGIAIEGSTANLLAERNRIEGCYIGTNAAGSAASIGNETGVRLAGNGSTTGTGARDNIIGGATAATRNVISGNTSYGVTIEGAASTGNKIQGNFIGLNAAGTGAAANARFGIGVFAPDNVIGGAAGEGNVISGNPEVGVWIAGTAATRNEVQGNRIGTNAAGTAAIPNGIGVKISDDSVTPGTGAKNNTIGGSFAGNGNVISGNNGNGIYVTDGASRDNQISGNLIGRNAANSGALGNGGHGVFLEFSGPNIIGGGFDPNNANVIAHNGGDGVAVVFGQAGSIRKGILENSIFANGGLGIDLEDDGVTQNDIGDPDTGANEHQNFPVLTASGATIRGTLNSKPNLQYRIEFFTNDAADPSGFGEGQRFIGALDDVTTNAQGNATFAFTPATPVPASQFVTATATDPNDNTSEFSRAFIETPPVATTTIVVSSANPAVFG
ncbi:MAG: hypothetical protein M3347_11500, partial [Armatimonadota bacterium]|nr:hypothetical protein [Armatimonadota bacterium]